MVGVLKRDTRPPDQTRALATHVFHWNTTIRLPHLSSPKSSPHWESGRRILQPAEPEHRDFKRRLPVASHVSKDGYRYTSMPPIASWIMLANGQ